MGNDPRKIDWARLIREHKEWRDRNFPDDGPHQQALGMIEELGEFAHHHLKAGQGIRGSKEYHQAEIKDAIGDLTIFMLGVMSEKPPDCFATRKSLTERIFLIARHVGEIGDLMERVSFDPLAINYHCGEIVAELKDYCLDCNWDYADIVYYTWGKVIARDWQANKLTGGQ